MQKPIGMSARLRRTHRSRSPPKPPNTAIAPRRIAAFFSSPFFGIPPRAPSFSARLYLKYTARARRKKRIFVALYSIFYTNCKEKRIQKGRLLRRPVQSKRRNHKDSTAYKISLAWSNAMPPCSRTVLRLTSILPLSSRTSSSSELTDSSPLVRISLYTSPVAI